MATDGPLPEGERIKRRQEIAQAGRIIIKRQYEQLVSRQYGLGYLQDPEYVHEMRVAIRRMLAAIKTLGDDLDGQSRSIGKTLGDLGQFLGDVRDTDAFLEYLAQAAGEAPSARRRALEKLAHAYGRVRHQQHQAAIAAFGNESYARLRARVEKFLSGGQGKGRCGRPAGRQARRYLRACLQRFLCHGGKLRKLSPREQHELRIAGKNLRYVAEFFRDFCDSEISRALDDLTGFQDSLGRAHDLYVYQEWIAKRAAQSPPAEARAMAAVRQKLDQDYERSLDEAAKMWKSLSRKRWRKRFLSFI